MVFGPRVSVVGIEFPGAVEAIAPLVDDGTLALVLPAAIEDGMPTGPLPITVAQTA